MKRYWGSGGKTAFHPATMIEPFFFSFILRSYKLYSAVRLKDFISAVFSSKLSL